LKEEAIDRTLWITRFARWYGPAVRQNTELMDNTSLRFFNVVGFDTINMVSVRLEEVSQ
jgi:hypothetical protein